MLLTIYYLIIQKTMYPRKSMKTLLSLSFVNPRNGRRSHSQMFFKIGILKNFTNFTEKHLRRSLNFIKLLLEGVCKWASLVKILQSCHFNIFRIKDASERCPLWKILNKRDYWNVYCFFCLMFLLKSCS